MRNEHGPRAALPHVTPIGDNCVSACARTAMAVQVRRTISPFRATYLDTERNSRSVRPFQMPRPFLAFGLKWTTQIAPMHPIRRTGPARSRSASMLGLTVPLPESAHLKSACRRVLAPTRRRSPPTLECGGTWLTGPATSGVCHYGRRSKHPSGCGHP